MFSGFLDKPNMGGLKQICQQGVIQNQVRNYATRLSSCATILCLKLPDHIGGLVYLYIWCIFVYLALYICIFGLVYLYIWPCIFVYLALYICIFGVYLYICIFGLVYLVKTSYGREYSEYVQFFIARFISLYNILLTNYNVYCFIFARVYVRHCQKVFD